MRTFSIGFFLILAFLHTHAQRELNLHFLRDINQARITNPAFMDETQFSIAIPSFTSDFANTAFSINDILIDDDKSDSLILTLSEVVPQLDENEYLQFQMSLDWIQFAFKVKEKLQISLDAKTRANVYVNYPSALFSLIENGNAQYIGQSVDLGPDINISLMHDVGIGAAYQVTEKLSVGTKIHYLAGLANISTDPDQRQLQLTTDDEYYQLNFASNYLIQTSGITDSIPEGVASEVLFKPEGRGVAIDLGASYQVNEQWQVAASVTGLGGIKWNKTVKNWRSNGDYSFEGIDIWNDLFVDTLNFEAVWDSIQETFNFEEENASYRSNLPTKIYLSTVYEPAESWEVGGLLYGEWYRGEFFPAVSVNGSKQFGKVFQLGLSYAYKNKSWANLGAHIRLQAGAFQLFFLSDNLIGVLSPRNLQQTHYRGGINFVF